MGKLQLQQQADTQDHQTKVAELQIKLMKDKATYELDVQKLQALRDTAAVGHLVDLHKHTKEDIHKKLQLAVDLSAPENTPAPAEGSPTE
jgi:ABC-type transporter Mla MlaB component